MATSGNQQRRMVFDVRGRRRHVIKGVYAVLALLMGASLFLVVGPVNIGALFGNSTTGNASTTFVKQAENIERKLKRDPENPDLLVSLTRARVSAGNSMAHVNPQTGGAEMTSEGLAQLNKASESWSKYLKATKEPSEGAAQLAAQTLFTLAQYSRSGPEAEANVRAANHAQQIVAEKRPSLGSLSTLAIYRAYSFDYPGAKEAQKEAEKYAHTKFERENIGNQLKQIEKRAQAFQKQLSEISKEAKKARAKGEPALANPLSESNPLSAP